jgi:ethanolamine utilization protein EutP
MAKAMFIGASGSGKTTLYQRLFNLPLAFTKTQALEFNDQIVDTPGEYLENRSYYSALLVTSMEVDLVALVMSCTDTQTVFPPGFARMFTRPTLGIITKTDLLNASLSSSFAESSLRLAGVNGIVPTSAWENLGIEELKEVLGLPKNEAPKDMSKGYC